MILLCLIKREILKKNGIEIDEKYLWDYIFNELLDYQWWLKELGGDVEGIIMDHVGGSSFNGRKYIWYNYELHDFLSIEKFENGEKNHKRECVL